MASRALLENALRYNEKTPLANSRQMGNGYFLFPTLQSILSS